MVLIIVILLLACALGDVAAGLTVYPVPGGANASDKYEVSVSQGDVRAGSFTYMTLSDTRVDAAPYVIGNRSVSWTSFAFDGLPVTVTVMTYTDFQTCTVRPRSYGIRCQRVQEKTAQFTVAHNNSWMSVEFDFDPSAERREIRDKLLVFADEPELHVPDQHDPHVLYFDVGVHNVLGQFPLEEDITELYIAPGAFIEGGFIRLSDKPVKIHGRGILCGSRYKFHDPAFRHTLLNTELSPGSVVEGLTLVDPPEFFFMGASLTLVHGVKFLGAWTYNSDGVGVRENSVVEQSFIMANDDSIKTYYDNITVRDMVVWQMQNGAVVQTGWAQERHVRNVTISNVDVVHVDWCTFKAAPCNTSPNDAVFNMNQLYGPFLQDIVFTDVRIEGACPRFLYTVLAPNATGFVKNIRFHNVQIDEQPEGDILHSEIRGSAHAHISDWYFLNFTVAGRCASGPAAARITVDPDTTSDVIFVCQLTT